MATESNSGQNSPLHSRLASAQDSGAVSEDQHTDAVMDSEAKVEAESAEVEAESECQNKAATDQVTEETQAELKEATVEADNDKVTAQEHTEAVLDSEATAEAKSSTLKAGSSQPSVGGGSKGEVKDSVVGTVASAEETQAKSSESVCRGGASELDEMMDIGTLDQGEQELMMNKDDEDSQMEVDQCSLPTTSNTVFSVDHHDDDKPSLSLSVEDGDTPVDATPCSSSVSSEPSSAAGDSSSSGVTLNGINTAASSRNDSEQSASETTRSSPAIPVVKVKDEPIDEEYDRALTSSAASVKDEPDNTEDDLQIGAVYSVPPATDSESLPVVHPSSKHMACGHCKINLIKGQTAYQKKGSQALFCSTNCLTLSVTSGSCVKCYHCQKVIMRPQNAILAPNSKGDIKEFCGHKCHNAHSLNQASSTQKAPPHIRPKPSCSMCGKHSVNKHEVILSGTLYHICSDECFNNFRKVNKLSMAGCANCGSFSQVKPLLLKLVGCSKTLCSTECLDQYKEKTKITQPCAMCQSPRLLSDLVNYKNNDDSVNLFCGSSCVMAYMVQSVSSSGAQVKCDTCAKSKVPAYHLAMSDMTIRNFCSLQCVMTFQEKYKKSSGQLNILSKLPVGSAHALIPHQTDPPRQLRRRDAVTLNCAQCRRNINAKPEMVYFRGQMSFVCSASCSLEFKKAYKVTSKCEYCKIDNMVQDIKRVNKQDCCFCSDGCKMLYRHDLAKRWGHHCQSCAFCLCISKNLVTAQFGDSVEEFCSESCRSKYTVLFCHVGKCDICGHKGKLKENLPLLGDVKHFCDLKCLLKFCKENSSTLVKPPQDEAPVITNVTSLSGPTTEKPSSSDAAVQPNTERELRSRKSARVNSQTETVQKQTQPSTGYKILKNKALLCRPMVQNKGISCKTQTVDVEVQTDNVPPQVMVLPFPFPMPICFPLGMDLKNQLVPQTMLMPLPMPVPMFLPVAMDNAERLVKTIQEIREKVPADPLEADLYLMASVVAEQDDTKKKDAPGKDSTRQGRSSDGDNSDGDSTTDDSNNRTKCENASKHSDRLSTPKPPPMDLEADMSVETLQRLTAPKSTKVANTSTKRPKVAKETKPRKSRRSSKEQKTPKGPTTQGIQPDVPRLECKYGVEAWKQWVKWRKSQPHLTNPSIRSRPLVMKEDVLQCTTTELIICLCYFINEVTRPNGEPYSPDSLFYLCLGIQKHLLENGRMENIFMDRFYYKFSAEITSKLKHYKPTLTARGHVQSRVQEEYLWECKQLGAYSPIVLLNTLFFFCCKYFNFTDVARHRQLSFTHVMRCTKADTANLKTTYLRFYPPINEGPDAEVSTKKRKEEENSDGILEMMENRRNPLRCPVRLYEFYLSKCPESVKQRTDLFYLQPENCCVPNSPLWFSSTPLEDTTLDSMLTRILVVRELHQNLRLGENFEDDEESD
ncbi:zinc finger MYM-type protein 4 isoform X1 [Synchiropus splendidus]|uniref:zinc finger MYM-type protein 4 isoform X1 n=1 Tax=Synchiropus splendidus TaxID=270530 RepID=UPI00237EE6D0|nr:zinc finger MYM-type protein 4 isoform X1 [Synchiropus splendidus]